MSNLLILDRKNTRLDAERQHLLIRHEGLDRPRCLPLTQVGQIVVIGRVEITSTVLSKLSEAGIGFMGLPRGRADKAWFQTGECAGNTRRRLAQMQITLHDNICREYARKLVQARIRSQARLMRRVASQSQAAARPGECAAFTDLHPADQSGNSGAANKRTRP